MPESVLKDGIDFIVFLQGLGDWLLAPMEFFTFLGTEEFYLLIMPALYWCLDASLGLRLGVILLISGGANSLFKLLVHDPRPYWTSSLVRALAAESSFGIPSGHAQNAVVIWGLLGVSLRRGWAWIIAILLIFLIGFSRMYLAVHFPTDVYTGWLIGFLFLVAFLVLEKPIGAWLGMRPLGRQVLFLFSATVIPILIGGLILSLLDGWDLPESWVQNAILAFPGSDPIDPLTLDGVITGFSALFGFTTGALLLRRQGGFRVSGPVWQRIARYIIGLIGVIVVWAGLDVIFPAEPDLLGYSFRFVRYSMVGLWISYLAPLIFLRIGLSSPLDDTLHSPTNSPLL